MWAVKSGACTVDSESCAMSPNYPERYSDSASCSIEASGLLYYTILYHTVLYYILYTIYYILYTIYYILYYTILYYTILYYILCIEVNAARALPVSALAFATEAGYDMLTVNGVVYHGSAGPEALTVSM